MPSHDGNPLLIQGNVREQLEQITRRYNASKADHLADRDEWQNFIYDAWESGVSIANLALWAEVSQARIGTILTRISGERQQQAAEARAAGVVVPAQARRPAA
jgi:hypothetical protein